MRQIRWIVGVSVLCAAFTAVGVIVDETEGIAPSVKSNAVELVTRVVDDDPTKTVWRMRNVPSGPNDSGQVIGFWGPEHFDVGKGKPAPKTNLWFKTWMDYDSGYTWLYYDTEEILIMADAKGCSLHDESLEIFRVQIWPIPTGDFTIPKRIAGKPVIAIGNGAFCRCGGLTSVTIPDGVKYISRKAFAGCSSMTNISIPNGVKVIGDCAFECCSNLVNLTIPDSVVHIGKEAFKECPELLFDTKTIPGVKLVDGWAVGYTGKFSEKLDLTGIRGMGDNAFEYCRGLESVTIPGNIKRVCNFVFAHCPELMYVTFREGVQEIVDYAFSQCPRLSSISFPTSITNIGQNAFSGCEGLTSLSLPARLPHIGVSAFASSGLTNLPTSDAVTSIGNEAFSRCEWLRNIQIPDHVTNIAERAFDGCTGLRNLKIGGGVTHFGEYAFSCCSSLENVSIAGNGVSIGESMFSGCRALTNVTILAGVTNIARWAFHDCIDLVNISMEEGVIAIEDEAFKHCSQLTSIRIPASVTSIDESSFEECYSLEKIEVSEMNPVYKFVSGLLISKRTNRPVGYVKGDVEILNEIIDTMKEKPSIRRDDLAEEYECPVSFIDQHISVLEKVGIIRRVTDEEGEHWEVVGNYVETPVGRYDYNF